MRFQKWTFLGHGSKSTRLNRTYAKGEKCATALFTEIDVGNDTPVCFLDKIYLQSFFSPRSKYELQRTFENFYSFDIFVVNRSSALFNEFITLDTKFDNFCAFHT